MRKTFISSIPGTSNIWFSLIVPTYNEYENLPFLLTDITNVLDSRYLGKYEIIIVDDNSPDGTGQAAQALSKQYPQLRIIVRKGETGLGSAVVAGWQQAKGEILGVMDADLQHPAPILVNLLRSIEGSADLALASRYIASGSVGNISHLRKILSCTANSLAALILPEVAKKTKDLMSGYFVIKRQAIDGIALTPKGYKILLEVLVKAHIKQVEEIPYEFDLRKHGQTKVTSRKCSEYLLHLLALRYFLCLQKTNGCQS